MRIKAHKSQASVLKPLKAIFDFTDDETMSSVAEMSGVAMEDVEGDRTAATKFSKDKSIQVEEELLEALVEDEVEELEENPTRVGKATAAEVASLLAGKFVNLTDLIPPLPDKGSFQVESIKQSQYFFS